MPISARGSKVSNATRVESLGRGFTLIELLLVVALIAITSALAGLALRDPASSQLEKEGARLAALLEAARTEARAGGLTVVWRPLISENANLDSADFRFVGLPKNTALPTRWLKPGVIAQIVGASVLALGPEPMIGAQRVVLQLDGQQLAIATDGLGPFSTVVNTADTEEP